MFDLHTHTTFSDGVLIPAESARRAIAAGYSGIAFTDHADESNYRFIIENMLRFKAEFNEACAELKVLVGVEITHVLPKHIGKLTEAIRAAGADLVNVHGETIVEPVAPGTNEAAIEAGVDILAHPGIITPELVKRAADRGVHLEITTRKGHNHTNGLVAKLALEQGAKLVLNNDYHAPGDAVSRDMAIKILLGCGLTLAQAESVLANNKALFEAKLNK